MLSGWSILLTSLAYLCLLFAIAYYVDKRADAGRSVIANPYIYALSIAVYCTSWTFYGSVGRAASSGIDFLPIYLGPTLTFVVWWFVLRKIIRISKAHRITSIADFISSRYGKSTQLGVLVTVIAVVGIMPYISLQLKAVSTSFNVLLQYPEVITPHPSGRVPVLQDTAFLVALVMAAFAILFGTRHIDASEHHEGMVAAIAFESLVKLIAFLAVGLFVTFGLYDGFADLFTTARATPEVANLLTLSGASYGQWMTLTLLSMAAIVCLPRQFQVTVVENVNEAHLEKAVWLFPLYLLIINIFVLPIALGGRLAFPGGGVDADTFVLTLPMFDQQEFLALFAFIGGLSAATGMVIVAAIALSTMVSNDLVMPVLLRLTWLRLTERGDLTVLLLFIRRASIILILLLGYAYFHLIGESDALVTIGLVSFAAAAQFAPAIIGGIFWKAGTRRGAVTGLSLGFAVWAYTLLLPSFARSGWLPIEFIDAGPLGMGLLKPHELFGLQGMDSLSHALFWSMLVNIGGYVALSLRSHQSAIERIQAALFVDVFRQSSAQGGSRFWRGSATVADLRALIVRFVGKSTAERALGGYARARGLNLAKLRQADADLVNFTERLLAGAIGAASARVMVASVAKGEVVGIEEVMKILEETSQVIEYSHTLEQKSRELEATTAELRAANERLKELDRLKDDFLSTVSHELRTPLTSIRSFSEILFDNPDLDTEERSRFLTIIVKESERLTRLINQILDLAKMEAGRMEWELDDIDPRAVIDEALAVSSGLLAEKSVRLEVKLDGHLPRVHVDRDRLMQVIVNLLSNAVKFCHEAHGLVVVSAETRDEGLYVSVADNGPGVAPENRRMIFEKFQQANEALTDRPGGSGLGLAISRQIVEYFGGRIWVESVPGHGAKFAFTIPLERAPVAQSAE
ncbi:MAG: sensor histidine kinase [Rhodospirillales bacterium]|nr:sensor histidine kinase [Rhodospirillales bacterium]MDH3910096.1 sensor histidine kinase [Rhodospirillales bacterium]MDH3917711.1 sensor histidine kinase [Rhodospirillales bacterium]MDH3967571.1 sensor histidine kinase [Rhodospirillales bacterium]